MLSNTLLINKDCDKQLQKQGGHQCDKSSCGIS